MAMPISPKTRLLTCYTWVSSWHWYQYAQKQPERVPWVLLDFSPCQDPFLDPYASTPEVRQPVISGLCRNLRATVGQRFLFITRIDPRVYRELGYGDYGKGSRYFGIVALEAQEIWPSHAAAAEHFVTRQYVAAPQESAYPPNLAHSKHPRAAVERGACIVRKKLSENPAQGPKIVDKLPYESTDAEWQEQYRMYHARQKSNKLNVARCHIPLVNGLEVLLLHARAASSMGAQENPAIFTPKDWGKVSLQGCVNGLQIDEGYAADLRERIVASSRYDGYYSREHGDTAVGTVNVR